MSFNNNATNLYPNIPNIQNIPLTNDTFQLNNFNSLNGWNLYGTTTPTFCWNNFNGKFIILYLKK